MKPEVMQFILITFGSSLATFYVGFQLGAFDTVSYRIWLSLWVFTVVVLLVNFIMEKEKRFLSLLGIIVLSVPSILLITYGISSLNFPELAAVIVTSALFIGGGIVIITVVYLAYAVIRGTRKDVWRVFFRRRQLIKRQHPINRRYLIAFICIIAAMAGAGFLIGDNHALFLITCSDFERAGDYVPRDCIQLS